MAFPIIVTLFTLSIHSNSPPLFEIWNDKSSFLLSLFDQNGINEQWDDPVAGSSRIVDWGVKYLETKSAISPTEVTTTPPGSKFIWSK